MVPGILVSCNCLKNSTPEEPEEPEEPAAPVAPSKLTLHVVYDPEPETFVTIKDKEPDISL